MQQFIENKYAAVQQLMDWNRYQDALIAAEKLLQEDPEDSHVYSLIGLIYLLMEQYEKALSWAQEALRRDPESTLAWYVRVVAYYETDQVEEFESSLKEALRFDPYEDHYYYLKGSNLNVKGKVKEAKEQILIALEIEPEEPLYLAFLSYCEALLGDEEQSRKIERQALQQLQATPDKSDHSWAFMHLAWAATKREEYELAEKYMSAAVRLNPEDKQTQNEYLEALQKSSKLYRSFLWPAKMIRKLKPWQILFIWIVVWALFKALVILFIVLYAIAYWMNKAVVHIRVFGWRRRN